MSKGKGVWFVNTNYPTQNLEAAQDELIERTAGMQSTDSGYGFGEREIGFMIEDRSRAREVARRLRGAYITGLQVSVRFLKEEA